MVCDRALCCLVLVGEDVCGGLGFRVLELRWRLLLCWVSVAWGSGDVFACSAWGGDGSLVRFRALLVHRRVVLCAAGALPAVWPGPSSNL